MSWNYSGDPKASEKDMCRFLIGDTIQGEPIMQDEEIQFLIDEYGTNDNLLKHQLFNRVAVLFARDIKRSLGPQSEDPTERLRFFKEQAAEYKRKLAIAGISIPSYGHPKVFHKGMQNNPPWPRKDGA